MSKAPLLSYIVLSYNYERYIVRTLQSIFDQSVQDFEIVVVDDRSTDNSVGVVSAIADPRVRLFVNDLNIGGAASYNRAIQEARGEWLVNLDADDWIDPRKAEIQLQAASDNPQLDIIGTYIAVHDENDAPHPSADALEKIVNQPHNLNLVDTWIGANYLCRSSTMVKSSTHKRLGLDDASMVRAPDYELWTRALSQGCLFGVVPQRLTSMRLHSRGVTHADPSGTLLEMSYAMLRNLIPLSEARALYPSIARMVTWVARHPSLNRLPPTQAHRLLGMLMQSTVVEDFSRFKIMLANPAEHPECAAVGRRSLSLAGPGADPYQEISKLNGDIEAYIEAREYWRAQSEAWELRYRALEAVPQARGTISSRLWAGLVRSVRK